jgi:uracil-DNA glycosylase
MQLTLLEEMKECTRCRLRKGCNQVVTGIGNIQSPLLIVGECPGADEDLEGEPFVGRSGVLLNKLLSEAKINRSDIYISNAVKCRPPNNRKPLQDELDVCKIWLWKEIQMLSNLKIILTLGATPTSLLLKLKNITMSDLVGRMFTVKYTSARIIPWYHPSYLLRKNNINLIKRSQQCLQDIKELL